MFVASQPYGIYVNGAVGVRIVGASCKGQYQWITIGENNGATAQQAFGIYLDEGTEDVVIDGCDIRQNGIAGININVGVEDVLINSCDLRDNGSAAVTIQATTGAVQNISIRNCNVTGYSSYSAAISVTAVGSNAATVQVTDCAGYNDQAPSLTTTLPASTALFYNYTNAYYGPVTFFVGVSTDVNHIKINGHDTGLKTGMFLLQPGVSGEIDLGTAPSPTFLMLGQ
jgi:hypothetical protein